MRQNSMHPHNVQGDVLRNGQGKCMLTELFSIARGHLVDRVAQLTE